MRKTIEKRIKSPFPLYIAAGCILLVGLILPLYRLWGILLTAALSVAAYLISKRFFPDRIELVEVEPEYRTGIKELDESLGEASERLRSLRGMMGSFPDARINAAIARMVRAGDAILDELNSNPQKARSMRRFLSYYLPTSEKLMLSYRKQANAGFSGENIDEIKTTVEENAERIAKAFETSLDSLYAGEALDITSDADVLEKMVDQDRKM